MQTALLADRGGLSFDGLTCACGTLDCPPVPAALAQAGQAGAGRTGFNAPAVDEVDLSGYSGAVGDPIVIRAHDDFKVTEVHVSVNDANGQTVESGGTEVRVASLALPPAKPVASRKLLNTTLAGMVGLMLGVFAVFAAEWWQGGKQGNETA